MKKIKFTGWRKGMNKIEFVQVLRTHTEISLKESRGIKDKILDGEVVEIIVHEDKVDILISEAIKFGVHAEKIP